MNKVILTRALENPTFGLSGIQYFNTLAQVGIPKLAVHLDDQLDISIL